MANALEELLEVLRRQHLPNDYPFPKVSHALKRLGFSETIQSSHHKFRKRGCSPLVIKNDGGKTPRAAMRDLKALFTRLGLL